MKKIVILIVLFLLCLVRFSYAAIIANTDVTVFGTVFNIYVPENTIDDNPDTFWHGLNDIQIGQTNYLSYRFNQPYALSRIDFQDNYQNHYFMGELDIQTSQDSTNGVDGSWATIDHIAGDFNPDFGDFSRTVDIDSTSWVRLFMTYEGRAAHGGSPAFYLSEIDFDGEPATAPVPEPTTLSLLGLGLLGLVLRRRR